MDQVTYQWHCQQEDEGVEDVGLFVVPNERNVLLEKVRQWPSDICNIFNKPMKIGA